VICDLAGEPRRLAGPPAVDGTAAWSPAGDRVAWIAATRVGELWSADPAVRKGERVLSTGKSIDSFSFASDGARVCCAIGPSGERDVVVCTLPDGAPKRLAQWPFDDYQPAFSPDGSRIAFWSTFRPLNAAPGRSLVVVAADGSDPSSGAALMERTIARAVSAHASGPPAWSPDSKWIVAVEPRTEDFRALVLFEVVGNERHELSADTITNEDPVVSTDGVVAWRARQEWGDHIIVGLTARGATRSER
jgi:Tol biopolymer transport system component